MNNCPFSGNCHSESYHWQMRQRLKGLCIDCNKKRVNANYCEEHRLKHNAAHKDMMRRKRKEERYQRGMDRKKNREIYNFLSHTGYWPRKNLPLTK